MPAYWRDNASAEDLFGCNLHFEAEEEILGIDIYLLPKFLRPLALQSSEV